MTSFDALPGADDGDRPPPGKAGRLLAVDAGLKTGLALFDGTGRVLWARSQNFGARARLRRAANVFIRGLPGLTAVAVEGGGPMATPWLHEAERLGLRTLQTHADRWRRELLRPRDRESGKVAKAAADELARRVLAWSGAPRPTSLRHDAAEAVLVGLWAARSLGLLDAFPPELRIP